MKTSGNKRFKDILLYIPNLIGYLRLCLLIFAYICIQMPSYFLILYTLSISLDFFDGFFARKLNQSSAFGAWLDVIVDNISRTCLWANTKWGWIIASVEWVTFVCNHQAGSKWREESFKLKSEALNVQPIWLLKVMENGFKTPLGSWVILGLHCLPIWIYAMQTGITDIFMPYYASVFVCIWLICGRLICLACELLCIKKHIIELLLEDMD